MTTVCIPTLSSINEFWKCVESVKKSSIGCRILAIDNGGLIKDDVDRMFVHRPKANLGVAASWNWFIDNTQSYRIITNDDIVFHEFAIESMLLSLSKNRREGITDLISPENLESPFSCFLLPDEVVEKVGRFDEWISPRYAYFEDNDYSHRMSKQGVGITKSGGCFVDHIGSSTIKHFDYAREQEHHERFRLARRHYVKKWGGEPGHEIFETPFNK